MLKKLFLYLSIVFLVLFGFSIFGHNFNLVQAEEDDVSEKADDLLDKIDELEKILSEKQNLGKTLANEIAYFDGQINLTQLRIQNAIAEIDKRNKLLADLVTDIGHLEERIDKLAASIDYQTNVLNERMRARYKSREASPLLVFFGSTTFDSLVKKAEYLKILQEQDQKLLDDMRSTKDAFTMQKDLFEEKKQQTEELKAEVEAEKRNLEFYKSNLDSQQSAKKRLLEQTKNDEVKYQKLLADAQRELAQIVNAAGALQGTEPRDVEKGEIIGIQGNTGYSFGDHLHFGVYRYGSIEDITGWNWYYSNTVNPAKKLKSKSVYWNTGCESAGTKKVGEGSWSWPLSSPTVSQGYGHTCYSDTYYDGKDHPAYDMYGPYGSPIYAVEDGEAYFCRNCLGDGGNGVFIFHNDDYMTVYWHLQ